MRYDVGETLDRRYRLKRLVARSERGVIFEADHAHLDRTVAVRLLADAEAEDPARERLWEEARRLDRVHHPAVLRIVDVAETAQGTPFVVTEAIVGRTLDGLLAVEGHLQVESAVEVALAVADALAAAHAVGVFHASLAPSSILCAPSGASPAARLLDVGVAPSLLGVISGPLEAMAYAAPERLGGGEPDGPSDVHALGAILHEMLTGELPARGEPGALPDGVSEALAAVVERARGPRSKRFGTAAALADALRQATRSEPPPASLPPPARAFPRAPYVTPVRVRAPEGAMLDGRTEDISEGGLLLLVNGEIPEDVSVLVRFALPGSGRLVSVPARTRWARRSGGREALGVRFEEPGDRVLEDIRAYVEILGRPS